MIWARWQLKPGHHGIYLALECKQKHLHINTIYREERCTSRTRKHLKTSRWKKLGNLYPGPSQWCDPRGSRLFLLKHTIYECKRTLYIHPKEGILNIFSPRDITMNESGLVHVEKADRRMTKPTNGRKLQALILQTTAHFTRLTRPPIRTIKIAIYANLQLSQITCSAFFFASVSKRVCEKAVKKKKKFDLHGNSQLILIFI